MDSLKAATDSKEDMLASSVEELATREGKDKDLASIECIMNVRRGSKVRLRAPPLVVQNSA